MNDDPAIYTRTMAKVFAQQGHHDRAIEIYRYLLQKNPNQEDLINALKEAEKAHEAKVKADSRKLAALIGEWIELLQKFRLIRILNRLWEKKRK